MKLLNRTAIRFLSTAVCASALATTTNLSAQQPQKPENDDVLRVNTELVQTAVTVVDKNGKFVDGLTRDQFELVVDGKPRPVSFFERVTAGSAREQQLVADGKAEAPATPTNNTVVQGRRIIFFID